ncbi:unnamed protein product [Staurois parvus]|uniref:Uncharacterized protein n=1 Tax=Staurois parvus TaxID=386267 RepID=A0ABN9CTG5_9NEOB|nr:unnamed protein product [Staurois parvus]
MGQFIVLLTVGGQIVASWASVRIQMALGFVVSRRKSNAPSLVSVGGNNVPSLVSVGGIVSHHWYQWEE